MTLAQLRYFCTAAQYHSITKAAEALFVTQPTVSIAVRDLEKEFALSLFSHAGNRLVLTEEGEAFYRKAHAILASCDDLQAEYVSLDRHRIQVRIGIPPMLSTVFFPELLDAFHEKHPDIWLELQEFGSVRCCDLVQDEILDIGLINMEIPNIDKYSYLELTSDPLYYAVSSSHPLAGRTELSLSELDEWPLILYNQDSVQNQIMQARFNALNISPRIVMRSSQLQTILKFLRQGSCGCFLYKRVLEQFPELSGIALSPEITTKAGLIWKRGRFISSGMQAFVDFCREYY